MGQLTKIQWTDHTLNLWWGCSEVHAGCDHCYARVWARAKGKGDGWEGARFATKGAWKDVLKWQRAAGEAGRVSRVFCGSMMDLFEKPLPASDWQGNPLDVSTGDLRDRFFVDVVPRCPGLVFQLLTKRPGNVPKAVPAGWLASWPGNVLTGASVSDQASAATLLPQLARVPGPLFVSAEPLLGPLDLSPWLDRLAWVILGGESGAGSRACDVAWIRGVVAQCRRAAVPVFVKQLGASAVDAPNGLAGKSLRVGADASALVSKRLADSHGADPSEWPEDLQGVREFPAPFAPAA